MIQPSDRNKQEPGGFCSLKEYRFDVSNDCGTVFYRVYVQFLLKLSLL